jgi:hypothetical protein
MWFWFRVSKLQLRAYRNKIEYCGVTLEQGCGVGVGVEAAESESEGILGGVGVGKNVPTPTSILNLI